MLEKNQDHFSVLKIITFFSNILEDSNFLFSECIMQVFYYVFLESVSILEMKRLNCCLKIESYQYRLQIELFEAQFDF